MKFIPGRPNQPISAFSFGVHECVGREIATRYIIGMVKLAAGLKELRPAPGQMGEVKTIQVGTETCYLNDSWSYLMFDASTWKLHFDGFGQKAYDAPKENPTAYLGLGQVQAVLK